MKCRVLQWNVWYKEKAQNIIEEISRIDADIVCLQELTVDSYVNPGVNIPSKIAELGYFYQYISTLKRAGDQHYHMGNGIFSKFPITYTRHILIGHEGSGRENRIYLEVKITSSAGSFWVGTTHLSWLRGGAVDEAARLLKATKIRRKRFIFTGDLNVTPESKILSEIQTKLLSATSSPVPTWPSKPYQGHGMTVKQLDRQLDYIFVSPDITIISTEAVKTAYSDHLPLLAEIEI